MTDKTSGKLKKLYTNLEFVRMSTTFTSNVKSNITKFGNNEYLKYELREGCFSCLLEHNPKNKKAFENVMENF